MRRPVSTPLRLCLALCFLWMALASSVAADSPRTPPEKIPYARFVLPNGLTLIMHEDHKAPIVAVNLWYHVGSKNEVHGKTGFAHLFEHLLFGSTEHSKERFMDAMERIGATSINGTTNVDRTSYFENVPTSALDFTLWMESERMGHLLGALDQKALDLQRGVVQNEKRQGENRPYGVVRELLTKGTHPSDHPYSWTTIGDMADLDAASLKDVHEWFKTYYGPSNAVLVLAGDIDPATTKTKVERYFGGLSAGPPLARNKAWIAKMSGTHRQVVQDRVTQARLYKVWNIPGYGEMDADLLDLVSDCLSMGKSSRLYRRLVQEEQIATDVAASVKLNEMGGQFIIQATAQPGDGLRKVEAALDEELARFLNTGPTREELDRARTQEQASFLRAIERVGGLGGKSDQLAMGEVFTGSPDGYLSRLDHFRGATMEALRLAASRWLSDGVYVLEVLPFAQGKSAPKTAKAEEIPAPAPGATSEIRAPKLQRATLSNGLEVVLSERHDLPLAEFWMMFDAGIAADRFATPGTASMTALMLPCGTKSRSSVQISDQLASLGANLRTSTNLDTSILHLSLLTAHFKPTLELFADVVQHPAFPQGDFESIQKQQISEIQREVGSPMQAVMRVMPPLLYGPEHLYAHSLTGSGSLESVKRMKAPDLASFYAQWFHPGNAKLVVVGDCMLADLVSQLEKVFAGWKPVAAFPRKTREIAAKAPVGLYLIDRPGSQQSFILATQLAPPPSASDAVPLELVNDCLSGTFGSRLSMNLRESKHWTYAVGSYFVKARGDRPWMVYTPVQIDQTLASLKEIQKELKDIVGDKPITDGELAKMKSHKIMSFPGSIETLNELGNTLLDQLQFGLPEDHREVFMRRVSGLRTEEVNAAARSFLKPDSLLWIIVGDRKRIEADLRQAGLGEVHMVEF